MYALKYGYTKGEHGDKPWILVGPPNIFSRKKALFPVQEHTLVADSSGLCELPISSMESLTMGFHSHGWIPLYRWMV